MDDLDGKVYPAGTAALTGAGWSFTVADTDTQTPTLAGCAIAFRIFELDGTPKLEPLSDGTLGVGPKIRRLPPLSATPSKVLTLTAGLTRTTDDIKLQAGLLTIIDADLGNLLGDAAVKAFRYTWVITPVNSAPLTTYLGGGYDGTFVLGQEGYSLEALAKVA